MIKILISVMMRTMVEVVGGQLLVNLIVFIFKHVLIYSQFVTIEQGS